LSVRFDEETVFRKLVLDEVGSEETPGLVKSQNTAEEAEELSLLLLNLRLLTELNCCESSVLYVEEPPDRKSNESMYDDFVAKNLLLLLLLFPTSENFSKFLSFNDDIELILDIIFILGVFCKLFKLSNECLEMRELFLSVDAFDDEEYIPPSLFLLFSLEFPFCGSQISDIF
jgi:hypothetical protein